MNNYPYLGMGSYEGMYQYNYDGFAPMSLYNYKDKRLALKGYLRYMLDRLQMLFEYEGLPDSIPKRDLEMMLLVRGHAAFYAHEGNVYVASGAPGGEPNEYYMPSRYIIAVPAFNLSRNMKIDEDCVVIPNDSAWTGMMPLLRRYCSLMVENDLTMRIATVNTRLSTIITAPTENLRNSAEKYMQRIDEGDLAVMSDRAIVDGIKTQPYAGSGHGNQITQLIELQQYLKASLFNEIGLNANWNAKRETLNDGELAVNNQVLLPLIDDMLHTRRIALEKFNDMYGFDASVRFGSAWEDIEEIVNIESADPMNEDVEISEPGEETASEPEAEAAPEETSVEAAAADLAEAIETVIETAVEEIIEEKEEDEDEAESD